MSTFFVDDHQRRGLEKWVYWGLQPFRWLAKNQVSSGVLLILLTLIAMLIANSPLHDAYQHFLHTHLQVSINQYELDLSLHHWINDALMAIFFYLVGLEIKKEILVGALSSPRKALLPIACALGGMIVPALIFTLFNFGGEAHAGWGIPMATDIAFALAVLLLLGKRVPSALVTLLLALAIVDDLGAVLVIAIFYTEQLSLKALGLALGCFAFLCVLNRAGIRALWIYFLLAVVMWIFMLNSGVHATIAGVLGALATPSRSLFSPEQFSSEAKRFVAHFDETLKHEGDFVSSSALNHWLNELGDGIYRAQPPSERLTHIFHSPVYFGIIPLFVLANAGVRVDFSELDNVLTSSVSLGVMLGLLLGKFLGVLGAVWLSLHYRLASLPTGVGMKHIIGMAILAGIGFTMSIFVAELAYSEQPLFLTEAKIAILSASVLAGVLGYLYLYAIGGKSES